MRACGSQLTLERAMEPARRSLPFLGTPPSARFTHELPWALPSVLCSAWHPASCRRDNPLEKGARLVEAHDVKQACVDGGSQTQTRGHLDQAIDLGGCVDAPLEDGRPNPHQQAHERGAEQNLELERYVPGMPEDHDLPSNEGCDEQEVK